MSGDYGTGSVQKRGDKWRVRLSVNGERRHFTIEADSETAAADWARAKRKELERDARLAEMGDTERQAAILEAAAELGLPADALAELAKREERAEPVSMSELLTEFEEKHLPTVSPGARRSYGHSLKPIRTYFVDKEGDPRVDLIGPGHVRRYIDWRRVNRMTKGDATVSARTVAKDRTVLHLILEKAEEWEYRQGTNPAKKVRPPKSDGFEPVIITDDQYEALLTECNREDRPMLWLYTLFLGETGARAYSEALHLRWEDVDFDKNRVKIVSGRDGHRTKSGKSRFVPMTRRLREAMRDHFARFRLVTYHGERSAWVFHHTRDRRHYTAGERVKDFRGAFDSAAKRAKLTDDFRRHDLRHRRVTTWLAKGKSAALVREAMGHSDLRTTMGYTHLTGDHLQALVDDDEPAGGDELKERTGS